MKNTSTDESSNLPRTSAKTSKQSSQNSDMNNLQANGSRTDVKQPILAKDSPLYTYLPDDQMDLIHQGIHLLEHVDEDRTIKFEDYSFIVFPFAKAYEGFLKQVFLDAGFITRKEYLDKYFRIGRVMSPNLRRRLGKHSVYEKICQRSGCELSDLIWKTWKRGRNQVFHYFPDNLRSLSLQEAEDIAIGIVKTMEQVVTEVKMEKMKQKLGELSMAEVKRFRAQQESS